LRIRVYAIFEKAVPLETNDFKSEKNKQSQGI